MNSKIAKKIRRRLMPKERYAQDLPGVSRGAVFRMTTQYNEVPTGVRYISWPLQILWGKIPVQMNKLVLKEGCPRAVYQRVKRRLR